jgi:NAD-dependent deacetylase
MDDAISTLRRWIEGSDNIVFFGGAGVSTESGIPDFRSTDGLYHQKYAYPPETILSHTFFMRNPEEFYRFYRDKMLFLDAKPNAAHRRLAEWERAGKLKAVITQNIDGLHQAAGSEKVLELHGSFHRNTCMQCQKKYGIEAVTESQGVPRCSCGGIIRPDVVVGGTSLVVYPAAGLVDYYRGTKLVLINKGATHLDSRADLHINGKIGEVLAAV